MLHEINALAKHLKLEPQFTGLPCVTPLKTLEYFGLRHVESVLDTKTAPTPGAVLAAVDALSASPAVAHHIRSAIRNLVPDNETVRAAVIHAFSHVSDSEVPQQIAVFPVTDVAMAIKRPKAIFTADLLDVDMLGGDFALEASGSSSSSSSVPALSDDATSEFQSLCHSTTTWAESLGYACDIVSSLEKDETLIAILASQLSSVLPQPMGVEDLRQRLLQELTTKQHMLRYFALLENIGWEDFTKLISSSLAAGAGEIRSGVSFLVLLAVCNMFSVIVLTLRSNFPSLYIFAPSAGGAQRVLALGHVELTAHERWFSVAPLDAVTTSSSYARLITSLTGEQPTSQFAPLRTLDVSSNTSASSSSRAIPANRAFQTGQQWLTAENMQEHSDIFSAAELALLDKALQRHSGNNWDVIAKYFNEVAKASPPTNSPELKLGQKTAAQLKAQHETYDVTLSLGLDSQFFAIYLRIVIDVG